MGPYPERNAAGLRCVKRKGHEMAKNTIRLRYDKDAEAAARFYAATFLESTVSAITVRPVTTHPARREMC
jgi:predicted 3-demethylubiquinone-9 3-methyltransferase (glyoxalase superfamily)